MKQKRIVNYYILISSIFILMLIILNIFSFNSDIIIEKLYRIYITLIFIILCIFGFSLSIYPRWYYKIIKKNKKKFFNTKLDNNKIKREGHHPKCSKFRNHVIKIKKKIICTGCLGLGIGSLISIFLIIYYFTSYNSEYSILYLYSFFLGLIIITISFIESFINNNPFFHVLSNIFLIIGFMLIIISTLENSGDIIYGLIAILASFLFLETRIQISLLKHMNICNQCIKNCKMY